ncbi:MAG: site-2 protease family protein [Clostridia bacterium]|nr:site-2 protease family protein [Clostridia bacterium]
MTVVFTIIVAILIFALMIFVHEFGHFIVAKAVSIRVLEFAVGMGPKIFSKQKGETLYSVRAVPIGGFCAMEGEDENSSDPRAINNKPAWQRFLVLAAGAFMNILLGFVLLTVMMSQGEAVATNKVAQVIENTAAYDAGLMPGDEIIKIAGSRTHIAADVTWATSRRGDAETEFLVKRNGEKRSILIQPREENGRFTYGFSLASEDNSFINTIKSGYYGTFFYSKLIVGSLVDLFRGDVKVTQLSGPIGIVSEIGSAVEETAKTGMPGLLNLINLAVILTINLGIFNLLPLPALDGGRIFFVIVEMIRRKPIPPQKEGMVHFIGFALLILLSIFVALMDIMKFWA